MKVAINSNGGVPGALPVQVEVSAEPEASNISWSGISYLNNFEFTEPGLQVWRFYNIGPDKVVPYNRFLHQEFQKSRLLMMLDLLFQLQFSPCTLIEDMWQGFHCNPVRKNEAFNWMQKIEIMEIQTIHRLCLRVQRMPVPWPTLNYLLKKSTSKQGKHKFYQEKESLLDMAKSKHANALLKEQGAIPKVSTIEKKWSECSCWCWTAKRLGIKILTWASEI